jgi:O-antigen biosynthesis protein
MEKEIKNPTDPREDPNCKTKAFWDKEAGTWEIGRGLHWTELIAVHERLNIRISGEQYVDLYLYLNRFMTRMGFELPVEHCLTLGCGAGDFERALSKHGFCRRHTGMDLSGEAIKKAKERAALEGLAQLDYQVTDINRISLPENSYDVVFGIHSVHHFSALEHIFSQTQKALKPGGFFVLYEFVGPNRFQWTDTQLNVINSILQFLPDRYCRSRKDGVTLKKRHWRPTLREMDQIDPSEAIRSEDILKVLPSYFEILERKDLGGTILHLLLDGIAGNFAYENPKDSKLLRLLFEIEDTLMELGEIPSDFVLVFSRKRS